MPKVRTFIHQKAPYGKQKDNERRYLQYIQPTICYKDINISYL
jgi:hypothetical protein